MTEEQNPKKDVDDGTGGDDLPENSRAFSDGPYLSVACIADMVLRDDTGVFSVIRMIDKITRTAVGPNPPLEMEPFDYQFKMVIGFKSGNARGHNELKVIPEFPDGRTGNPFQITAHFEGEERGFVAAVSMNVKFPLEGLYWFDVFLENQKITSIPLRVVYDRQFIR